LRNALSPLDLIFGSGLVDLFVENNQYVELVRELRRRFARQGILLPVVRIMDDLRLEENEFMVRSYFKVLHRELIESPNEKTIDYMVEKMGRCVWEKYDEVLSPDIVKSLVDNLKVSYPALIEGVMPEKISYVFLADIAKCAMRHEGKVSVVYLPKMIEIAACRLRENPSMTAEEIADKIARELCGPDNYWRMIREREGVQGK